MNVESLALTEIDWSASTVPGGINNLVREMAAAASAAAFSLRPPDELADQCRPVTIQSLMELISELRGEVASLREMVEVKGTGRRQHACLHCGTTFLTGTGTGRCSHALYCSDKCRVYAWRHRRKAAAV